MEGAEVRKLAADLWVVDRPFALPVVRAEVGTRMTILRLADRGLFLHSPVRLDHDLRVAISRLGEVRAIVAPSRVHHLFVGDYITAYPQAKSYAAPGLPERRREIKFDAVLNDVEPNLWRGQLSL